MLILLVAGVGLAQGVSSTQQVTARWLRLGGLVALALLVTADAMTSLTDGLRWGRHMLFALLAVPVVGQLMAVQSGRLRAQRLLAWATWAVGSLLAAALLLRIMAQTLRVGAMERFIPEGSWALACLAAAGLSAGLLGGGLMTMLLGHAYLTAGGQMTQKPFRRLTAMLGILVLLRGLQSATTGLGPWSQMVAAGATGPMLTPQVAWDLALLAARYIVGLIVPAAFLYMTWDCVRRRSNQSATGILYVAFVLLILGEGAALALMRSVGGAVF